MRKAVLFFCFNFVILLFYLTLFFWRRCDESGDNLYWCSGSEWINFKIRYPKWNIFITSSPNCSNFTAVPGANLNISIESPSIAAQAELANNLAAGGEFLQDSCQNPDHVAIVIPFRNRDEQLPIFLAHIHPFLMRQNIHYKIYIINQSDDNKFNRAALMNVGFKE